MEATEKLKKIRKELARLELTNQELFDLAYGLEFLANVCRLCEEALDADQERKTDLSFLAQKIQTSFYTILDVLFHHTQALAEEMQKDRFRFLEVLNGAPNCPKNLEKKEV